MCRSQRPTPSVFLCLSPRYFVRQVLSVALELTSWLDCRVPGNLLSRLHSAGVTGVHTCTLGFYVGTGIWTQVSTLVLQALNKHSLYYLLSFYPPQQPGLLLQTTLDSGTRLLQSDFTLAGCTGTSAMTLFPKTTPSSTAVRMQNFWGHTSTHCSMQPYYFCIITGTNHHSFPWAPSGAGS